MLTPLQQAKRLRDQHWKFSAGFYTPKGRAFDARVKDGQLEVLVDFKHWVVLPGGTRVSDHNGREILTV